MPSTHVSLHYHIVFSTKDRIPIIGDGWRDRMHQFLGGCVRTFGGTPLAVGGVADHVHAVAGLRATHCVSDMMCEVKRASSAWAHDTIGIQRFAWQEGYGAFSISPSQVDSVVRYTLDQKRHHQKRSFQEEYRALLQQAGIEYDERYLW
jgi:putative transposase